MKPEYKPLKELNDKTLKYKTKVKVIHKSSPQQSPNKPPYQRLLFKDDEGFTMKGALFNSDIEKYAEALEHNGEYELSNAMISAVPPQHASKPNEYSIIINARAQISPLTNDATALGPQYQAFATIPRDPFNTELIDVLGVVIYVTAPKAIYRSQGIEDSVREIHLTDHRPILKVDAVHDSGSMALTFFAKEVEYLVGIPCIEMWKLKENDNDEVLAEKMFSLRQKNVNIEIGPTLALSTSRVLNWTVRSVNFE
ncbi:Replication protein A 70 kDa DNA-binding subunit [Bienertia sinuspersici]